MNNNDKLDQKLDKLLDKVGEIDVTLAAQHVSLSEHMRRTSLLESKIEPMEKHLAMVAGGAKLASVIVICISAIAGIVEIIHGFHK